jgi:hypothetical protein
MTRYLLLLLLLVSTSCVGNIDEKVFTCTAIGYFDISKIDFHFITPISDDYTIEIDGVEISNGCFAKYPCFNQVAHLNNTVKIEMYFQSDTPPDLADLKLIDDNSVTRIDEEDLEFNWNDLGQTDEDKECRVQHFSKLDIVE